MLIAALSIAPLVAAEAVVPGVPNFHEVNEHIYRGGQPSREGFKSLAKKGVRTIVDLRGGEEAGGWEGKDVEAAGMHYIHVPMAGLRAPTDQQIATVLALLDDSSGWPVFIHCRRGADRTGTVVACYRIAHDRWDNQKALKEARMDGMSWVEKAMQQYILRFKPPAAATKADLSQSTLKVIPAAP